MIRLFVGTDPHQHVAERALEASVRRNTSQPVGITWMRQGDPGWDWGGMDAGWPMQSDQMAEKAFAGIPIRIAGCRG